MFDPRCIKTQCFRLGMEYMRPRLFEHCSVAGIDRFNNVWNHGVEGKLGSFGLDLE